MQAINELVGMSVSIVHPLPVHLHYCIMWVTINYLFQKYPSHDMYNKLGGPELKGSNKYPSHTMIN
jgi:hypothetical protein